MKQLLAVMVVVTAGFAAEGYHVVTKITLGGTGRWDYVAVDGGAARLYASHGNSVDVVDLKTDKKAGEIGDLHGVHGIAVAPALGKGFISNGQSNTVTVFNLKTLATIGVVPVGGTNPDSICYEPKTARVFTFNGRSGNSTAIDGRTDKVVATFPVGGKPEFCQADGTGKIYANIEDKSELVEIDAAKPAVMRRVSLAPCESPSGLAIDTKGGLLFSACDNKLMAITDYKDMKEVGTVPIGEGPDAAGFDPGLGLAFSSNGEDGTLSVVRDVGGKWQTVETVKTERGARTMAVDPKTHKLYLLDAEFGPAPEAKTGRRVRPPVLPGTFHVLVVGK